MQLCFFVGGSIEEENGQTELKEYKYEEEEDESDESAHVYYCFMFMTVVKK